MFRSRSAREKVRPADSSCRTRSPSSSDTVRSPRSASASRSPLAIVDLPEPDSPVRKITRPRSLRGGRARRSSAATAGGVNQAGHLLAAVQQVLELTRGQVGPLGAGLDQRQRPPHLGRPVVGPVARRTSPGSAVGHGLAGRPAALPSVNRWVAPYAAATTARSASSPLRADVPRGQRDRHDQRPGRQVPGGGADRPHQRLRPRTTSAGPVTRGSSSSRALSWPATCRSWPIWRPLAGGGWRRRAPGRRRAPPAPAAGVSRSCRNGPCSGSRHR